MTIFSEPACNSIDVMFTFCEHDVKSKTGCH